MEKKAIFPEEVKQIFNLFEHGGYEIYLVGGCVRDLLLQQEPHDYDFTTNATPEEMKELAKANSIEIIPTGEKYGTMTFKIGEGLYEITTFRHDQTYSDGRRPDAVTFSKILREDLIRRDFTINAMAMDSKREIYDYFGGQLDLKSGIIRTVGEPAERFTEDGLRILRAIRFASRFNFKMDYELVEYASRHMELLNHISAERIRDELFKTFGSYKKDQALETTALLDQVLAHLTNGKSRLPDNMEGLHYIEAQMAAICVEFDDGDDVQDFLDFLKVDNKLRKSVLNILTNRDRMSRACNLKERRLIILECLYKTSQGDTFMATKLLNFDTPWSWEQWHSAVVKLCQSDFPTSLKELKINGDDLKSLGIQGKQIGRTLNKLIHWVWETDPNQNNFKSLIAKAAEFELEEKRRLEEEAEWVLSDKAYVEWKCSRCGEAALYEERSGAQYLSNYCPHCGYKMNTKIGGIK